MPEIKNAVIWSCIKESGTFCEWAIRSTKVNVNSFVSRISSSNQSIP